MEGLPVIQTPFTFANPLKFLFYSHNSPVSQVGAYSLFDRNSSLENWLLYYHEHNSKESNSCLFKVASLHPAPNFDLALGSEEGIKIRT